MRRSALSLSAAAVLALSLSACSDGSEAEADGSSKAAGASTSAASAQPQASETSASESVESATASAEASSTEAADDGKTVFGDTHTWADGLAITISEPEAFKPTASAAGVEGEGTPIKFEVTVENGTAEPVPAGMINMQSSSGGAEDQLIVDSQAGVEPASVDIRPGKTLSWTTAYMVNDPSDQAIQVTNMNDFSAESVYFDVQ